MLRIKLGIFAFFTLFILYFASLTAVKALTATQPCALFPANTHYTIGGRGYHNGCEGTQYTCGAIMGYDYIAARGTPILAPFEGTVTGACWRDGVGNTVFTLSNGTYEMGVLHLQCTVSLGQHVTAGQQIGTVDMIGGLTDPIPHAHVWFKDLKTGLNIQNQDQFWACINTPASPPPSPPPSSPSPPPPPPPPSGTQYTQRTPESAGFNPLKYPCSSVTDSEFHPLRPYPGSPCDPLIPVITPPAPTGPDQKYITFTCNKNLNLNGTVTFDNVQPASFYPPQPSEPDMITDKYYRCSADADKVCVIKQLSAQVVIDMTSAMLPIEGNTQISLADPEKVNHYLDWYLNGTVQQSEHQYLDTNNPDDMNRLINYSGPIRKLISIDSQKDIRTVVHDNAETDQYHNYQLIPNNLIILPNRLTNYGIAKVWPFPGLQVNMPYSSLEDVVGEATITLGNNQSNGKNHIINSDDRRPSLIIDPANNVTTDSRLYFSHLKNDAAMSDLLASFSRPLPPTPAPPNPTPVHSTDKNLVTQQISGHQGFEDSTPITTDEYIKNNYKGVTRNTQIIPGQAAPARPFDPVPVDCDVPEVRTNPGDSLIGSLITANLTYYQLFSFTPPDNNLIAEPPPCLDPGEHCTATEKCCWHTAANYCPINTRVCKGPDTSVTVDTSYTLSSFTKSPYLEHIYSTLVSGNQSVFRRFLPLHPTNVPDDQYLRQTSKVEPYYTNTIPGYTQISYSATSNTIDSLSVDAGNGTGAPLMYFPHLGSLSDYFLGGMGTENKNLQKLLRPFGFHPYPGFVPQTPPGSTGAINCNISQPTAKANCIDAAPYKSKADALFGQGTHASDCWNDTISRARAAGVNPDFALLIWLQESGASNYTSFPTVYDFGQRVGNLFPPNDWKAQITQFLLTFTTIKSQCATQLLPSSGLDPVAVFGTRFYHPVCSPISAEGQAYADALRAKWAIIGGGCAFPFP